MNTRDAILRAAPVLAQYADPQDGLLRAGLSKEQAHDAVRFLPLAFGRDVLDGIGVAFSDTYVRIVDGQQEERALNDEPFFREARTLARVVATEVGFDTYNAIAMQSSEFQALNNALNAGAEVENLVAGPPMVMCEGFAAAAAAKPEKKPWWKVWG
ncbi:MAG TPA: hypothetical protein VKB93_20560 [Thermoanaerobaculia bacterium]|nr:hypothetical protein [Thermoanaerobaculia bacterium]